MKTLAERMADAMDSSSSARVRASRVAEIVAQHDAVMAQMAEALKFALPFAQAEWFKCIGNAPTSDAGYDKWSVDPAVLRMKGGMNSINTALSAYQSLGEQS